MTVPSSKVGSVQLDEVVKIVPGTGPSSINRINRQRQVTLTGNVLPGGSQAAILGQLNQFSQELGMDPDYRSGLTGASKELARTGYYFVLAFSLTFIFMYIVLAAQFESFIHPITILITLPLAVPFGIVSLLIDAPDREHLLRAWPAAAVRHREEERHSADRPHQWVARGGPEPVRRHHSGESRPAAADPHDDHRAGGRHGAAGDLARYGRGHQSFDRRAGGGWPIPVPAADPAGGARCSTRCSKIWAIRSSPAAWRAW